MAISPPRGICTLDRAVARMTKVTAMLRRLELEWNSFLYQGEQTAQDATQAQGADNLQQGIEHHGQEAEGAADHSFGHAKGDGKDPPDLLRHPGPQWAEADS